MTEEGKTKLRKGYRVYGPNTADGKLTCWYFENRDFADTFAKQLAADTGADVDLCLYLGTWRKAAPPVEFIAAEE